MAMSGIRLTDDSKIKYDEIYKGKKHRYAIYVIKNNEVDVEKLGDKDATYDQFLTDLKQKDGDRADCRYAVYDYEYKFEPQGASAQYKQKVFLLCYCPDEAPIKKKMLYSSSFDTLKRAFDTKEIIQANGADDVEQEVIEARLRTYERN